MSDEDKAAAKDLPKTSEEAVAQTGDEDDEEGEDKKPAKKEKKEEAEEGGIPELDKKAGKKEIESKKKKKASLSQKEDGDIDEETMKKDAGLTKINIGGEDIVVGALGNEDVQVEEELRSQDLINYVQTGADVNGDFLIGRDDDQL